MNISLKKNIWVSELISFEYSMKSDVKKIPALIMCGENPNSNKWQPVQSVMPSEN